MFHVKRSRSCAGATGQQRRLPACRRNLRPLPVLVSALLLAGCGTLPSGRDTPLPSVPGEYLATTPAPILLPTRAGEVDIKDALTNLRSNMTLLGECREREEGVQGWMRRAGLTATP